MKNITFLLMLFCLYANSQTPTSTQKGYYLQKIGDSVVGQNSRPDKAFFDLFNYMKERKIKNGTVTSPFWEITIDYSDTVNNDTIIINNGDISVGNQWMGEPLPITKEPIYGTAISDKYGANQINTPEKAFDNNTDTYSSRYAQSLGWIGQDYGEVIKVTRFRFLPQQNASSAVKMNGALIQYSDNGTNWTTIHEISGITDTNYMNWVDVTFSPVSARYFRIYATQSFSYCRVAELEFYHN